jgi:RimJ/RimL family protein N-acetyltransferase
MLKTLRLTLNVAILEDAAPMMKLNSDPEVVRYTGEAALHSLQEAEAVIKERMLPQFEKYQMGRFSVFLRDGTYIGWCGLRFFPRIWL